MSEYTQTIGPDGQTITALEWIGAISFSGGKAYITPSLGSELVTNGDMETGDPPSSYTSVNSGVLDGVADERTGGSGVQSLDITGDANKGAYQQFSTTAGNWYSASGWIKNVIGGDKRLYLTNTSAQALGAASSSDSASWTNIFNTGRATGTASRIYTMLSTFGTGLQARFDDVSVKELTLSSLFSSVSTSDTDVIADANVTLTAGTQAGIVTNLDSTSTPANFLIAYHDGTNVKLDKNVGGTYTNLISSAATYGAGYTLRVITYHSDANTLKVRVYYNNALIGSEQTVTDVGIISNTKHGLFSTYSGNSFDNFTLWPRGSGTTKFTDAPFEELTATRDTGTKYAGNASAKLVASGTDATFLQSVTLPDTSTYTLIAYAYTTGVAVTGSDVVLYYDTGELSTSYTDMGGGWYKLTGTLTGVDSAKNYGVKIKAGKTVYIDTVSLQAGTGATIEVAFENTSSGSSNYTFENNVNATEFIGIIDGNS